ncbi:hypothetical protein OESDEN_22401 [Oesophagostomum dentatum]|uniref:Uncharacterized protein n=1 Tax=Oesophagostomum dentatum TaxID=61180 RepID=A0A0B1RZ69_OESDE|nr:hypothetical protein OESDEN_22401 [Oesophagostomum dentatum]
MARSEQFISVQDAKAGTYDPNYQTLAGIGGDVFGADKKAGGGGGGGGAGPKAPANKDAKAGTYDPNYQTLAGIGGDVFGADKKGGGGGGDKKPVAPTNQELRM